MVNDKRFNINQPIGYNKTPLAFEVDFECLKILLNRDDLAPFDISDYFKDDPKCPTKEILTLLLDCPKVSVNSVCKNQIFLFSSSIHFHAEKNVCFILLISQIFT